MVLTYWLDYSRVLWSLSLLEMTGLNNAEVEDMSGKDNQRLNKIMGFYKYMKDETNRRGI
jgi:hypothetical protein